MEFGRTAVPSGAVTVYHWAHRDRDGDEGEELTKNRQEANQTRQWLCHTTWIEAHREQQILRLNK